MPVTSRQPWLTYALIAISVAVTLASNFGANIPVLMPLFISNYPEPFQLPEVRQGEVWRLFTPIFMHFHPLHLAFNMLWLWDLGRAIELQQSTRRLVSLVAAMAVLSNLGQFYFEGPRFGGMSGVVYGLLGYIWVQGHLDPRSGLFLHKQIAIMIMVWYVLCWTGLVGPVANMAHTVGLIAGLAIGFVAARAKHG